MRWLFIMSLFTVHLALAQDFSPYEKHHYDVPELNMSYRLLRPKSLDSSKSYPLIVFLHGAGQKGFDNVTQLLIGGLYFLQDSVRERYPAYVLFPQCPEIDTWASFETIMDSATGQLKNLRFPFHKKPTDVSLVLKRLIDSLTRTDRIDTERIYIGGISQGGMGVLDFVARYPETFAAAFAICGAGNVSTYKKFAGKVPLWLFHGKEDDVIPSSFSSNYYKKLSKAGSDVRYTEYPHVKHASWVNAFHEPELLPWIFSKKKEGR